MKLKSYAPFFQNGLLYLPDITILLLIKAGLAPEVAQSARRGLQLDDDRETIGIISNTLEKTLALLTNQPQIEAELTSRETRFMLSEMAEDVLAACD